MINYCWNNLALSCGKFRDNFLLHSNITDRSGSVIRPVKNESSIYHFFFVGVFHTWVQFLNFAITQHALNFLVTFSNLAVRFCLIRALGAILVCNTSEKILVTWFSGLTSPGSRMRTQDKQVLVCLVYLSKPVGYILNTHLWVRWLWFQPAQHPRIVKYVS